MNGNLRQLAALAIAASAVAWASATMAALSPCTYDKLVKAAAVAVQVEISDVRYGPPAASEHDPRYCEVRGRVRRSFRGGIKPGTDIVFTVPCEGPPVRGGTVETSLEELESAKYIEAYLEGAPDYTLAGHGHGRVLLDAPTARPAYVPRCK